MSVKCNYYAKDKIKFDIINMFVGMLTVLSISLCFILENVSGNSYVILGINLIAILLLLFKKVHIKYLNGIIFLILFAIYSGITSRYAVNPSISISMLLSYIFCIIIFFTYFIIADSIKNSFFDYVYIAGIVVSFVAILYYGLSTFLYSIMGHERLSNDLLNSNNLGILSALSILIAFYKFTVNKKSQMLIVMLLEMMTVLASQSRKAIIVVAMGVIGIYLLTHYDKLNYKTIAKIFLFLVVCLVIILLLIRLPIFNAINERMDGLIAALTGKGKIDGSTALRSAYRKEAIRQFKLHPIWGVGMDNCRIFIYRLESHHFTYSHCNYAELLCNGGIIGFSIYYLFYLSALFSFLKYRNEWTNYSKCCIGLLLILLIMDYGAVTYGEKSHWAYIVPIIVELKKLQLTKKKREKAIIGSSKLINMKTN